MKLENMGFDDTSIEQCKAFAGQDLIDLANWMVQEYYPQIKERLNEKHKEIYHVSMANVENYVPIRIDPRDQQKDSKILEGDASPYTQSLQRVNGSLVNRTVNTKKIDLTRTAFDVLAEHTQQNEEWIAYARVRQDIDYMLSSMAFRNTMNANTNGRFLEFDEACAERWQA